MTDRDNWIKGPAEAWEEKMQPLATHRVCVLVVQCESQQGPGLAFPGAR